MKNMKSLILFPLLLSGCAVFEENIKPPLEVSQQLYRVEKHSIPFLLEGSRVNLGGGWSLTAKHNKFVTESQALIKGQKTFYHPECDLSLIKGVDDGTEPLKLAPVRFTDKVYSVGYPMGYLITKTLSGEVVGDVRMTNWKGDCDYSFVSNTAYGGMSGGNLFNEKGESVGIIVGYVNGELDGYKQPLVFISYYKTLEWIEKIIEENGGN